MSSLSFGRYRGDLRKQKQQNNYYSLLRILIEDYTDPPLTLLVQIPSVRKSFVDFCTGEMVKMYAFLIHVLNAFNSKLTLNIMTLYGKNTTSYHYGVLVHLH